jgi:hypothetical protein
VVRESEGGEMKLARSRKEERRVVAARGTESARGSDGPVVLKSVSVSEEVPRQAKKRSERD